MRLLIIGDPHFKPNTLQDTRKLHSETSRLIREHTPNAVIILGDVLDRHAIIHMQPLNAAIQYVKMISTTIASHCASGDTPSYRCYVLVGNHDIANNAAYLPEHNSLHALAEVDGVKLVSRPYVERMMGTAVTFAPFVPNGRLAEALEQVDVDSGGVLFCHQELRGCKLAPGVTSSTGDRIEGVLATFKHIITGHIHHHCEYDVGDTHVTYVGSAYQITYAEDDDKAATLLSIPSPHCYELQRLPYETIVKRTVRCSIDEVQSRIDIYLADTSIAHARTRFIVRGSLADIDSKTINVGGKKHKLRSCNVTQTVRSGSRKLMREISVVPEVYDYQPSDTPRQEVATTDIDFIAEIRARIDEDLVPYLNSYLQ